MTQLQSIKEYIYYARGGGGGGGGGGPKRDLKSGEFLGLKNILFQPYSYTFKHGSIGAKFIYSI